MDSSCGMSRGSDGPGEPIVVAVNWMNNLTSAPEVRRRLEKRRQIDTSLGSR
jgi:hypothetical protein